MRSPVSVEVETVPDVSDVPEVTAELVYESLTAPVPEMAQKTIGSTVLNVVRGFEHGVAAGTALLAVGLTMGLAMAKPKPKGGDTSKDDAALAKAKAEIDRLDMLRRQQAVLDKIAADMRAAQDRAS